VAYNPLEDERNGTIALSGEMLELVLSSGKVDLNELRHILQTIYLILS